MTTDRKPQETEQPESGHVAPDPLAMSVASTAEDYTAEKLTPDPGSDIGSALPPGGGVEELPDTAQKDPPGPVTYEQLSLPEADDGDDSGTKSDSGTTTATAPADQPRGVTHPR